MVKNQLRIGAVLSYINMAIGSLIPMFYTPIMLDLLGKSEYGLYKLSGSVTSYLALISFGIGSAVVRYLTKYRTEGNRDGEEGIFGLFNIIFFVISGITVVAGVIIMFLLEPIYGNSITEPGQMDEMKILVIILSCTTALSFLCTPYNAVVTSHEKFLFLQLINIMTTVLIPVINLIVLFMGYKSIGIVTSSFILNILIRIAYIVYVRKTIRIRPNYKNLPKHLLKEILIFSFWIFIANVVNQLYNSTDTMIIGAIPSLATFGVAVYNIGVTFNSMLTSFSVGILSVLTPKVNGMVFGGKSNSELTDLMIRVGRLQCYIVSLVCTGFIAFGQQFIMLWVGEGYEEAYWVALATMIPASIPLVQNVAMNVIVAQNKHKFRSLVLLFIAILNVGGTILCVNSFGIVGAAIVTGFGLILGQGFMLNWYYWKKIQLEIPRFWKSVLHIFIIPIIMCVVSCIVFRFIIIDSWSMFLFGVLIYTLLFAVLNWALVMNDYEKDIFLGPLRKIKNVIKKV
jgi:O-antigen/teichoic acid export membrane protein